MPYQFKGIDITTVVDTTSNPVTTNFANVYQGLPAITYPNYTNSNLLTNLGYTDANGSDLSTVCAAIQLKYNSSQTISVPTGANQFRYFIIGGGGGGGGGGGCANNGGWQQSGGSGGNGGFGYPSNGQLSIAGANIEITIGTGGTGGGSGAYSYQNGSGYIANSHGGGSGNRGNTTTISYDNTPVVNAAGGLAGGGGGGAWAYRSNYHKNNRGGGGNGQGYTLQFDPTTSGWDPRYVTPQSGGGGGGGGYNWSSNGAPGNAGQPGYAVIVWLYD